MCHHKADTAACVAHFFIIGRIGFGHYLATQQHIRSLQDGIPEILIHATDGELAIIIFVIGYYLTDGVFVPEMGIGKLLAHQTAVPGHAPVCLVAFHKVITENVKERAVGCHRASVNQFASDGESVGRRQIGHAATLFYFREVVFQVLVQPVSNIDLSFSGNHIDSVCILLKGIRGQLPLNIHRQQEHECHRHRQSNEVDSPV